MRDRQVGSAMNVVTRVGLAVLALAAVGVWVFDFARSQTRDRALYAAAPAPREQGPKLSFDEWARREFERRHPGEKPLNWKIAEKAEAFHRDKPMGHFVLNANDCSDFVDAVVDDALGAQARFRRGSPDHILIEKPVWDVFHWDRRTRLQPGDELHVRHSPWYPPSEQAPWHVAIIGTDGMAYDWTKLKTWKTDRYNRTPVEWFIHNSPGPKEIVMARLLPEYRYLITSLPTR